MLDVLGKDRLEVTATDDENPVEALAAQRADDPFAESVGPGTADQTAPVPTLVLTGTVGAGKSIVAAEITDVLAAFKVPNAAIDLDTLVWQWPSTSTWNNDLMFENLVSLWPSYQAHGATHLILARVL